MLRILSLILVFICVAISSGVSTREKHSEEENLQKYQTVTSTAPANQPAAPTQPVASAETTIESISLERGQNEVELMSMSSESYASASASVSVPTDVASTEASPAAHPSQAKAAEASPATTASTPVPLDRNATKDPNRPKVSAVNPITSEAIPDDKQVSIAEIPKPAQKPLVSESAGVDGKIAVLEFVLATEMEDREPKGIVDNFAKGTERAFAFARLSSPETTNITFVWLKDNKEYTRYTTPVHAAKTWRTFSSIKLRPGKWKVQILKDNEVLKEKEFRVD